MQDGGGPGGVLAHELVHRGLPEGEGDERALLQGAAVLRGGGGQGGPQLVGSQISTDFYILPYCCTILYFLLTPQFCSRSRKFLTTKSDEGTIVSSHNFVVKNN